MSLLVANRNRGFLLERYVEGDELWMPKHPLSRSNEAIVISFDRTFEEIMPENVDIILSATYEDTIEIIYLYDGKVKDMSVVLPRKIPFVLREFNIKYASETK